MPVSTHLMDLDGIGQGLPRSYTIILILVYTILYNPYLTVHINQTHLTQKLYYYTAVPVIYDLM